MKHLPDFESSFLQDITESFSRVRKSIKYDADDLKFTKVLDKVSNASSEKIEITICSSKSRNSIRIRMYVWDDRWLWIDARRSTNINDGWEWEYTIEGKMSGSSTERELFDTLKSFYKESQMYNAENATSNANLCWKKLIATGPKEVVY